MNDQVKQSTIAHGEATKTVVGEPVQAVDPTDTVVAPGDAITIVSERVIATGKFVENEDGQVVYVQTAEDRGDNDKPAD